ncbi:hypothetical protein Q5741_03335 [Paenibacillus sp. JX-17]|uniref:DUF2157 domain-containing protein n=1 Tax=Paenibacillus lacisoli TaxID=3064525 RepID=A0ABT9CCY3_9BACL|nr:hypothetical protein [Paenibacillus sp. JX-17]MDO7905443.1 hypothetical protein [Paenibacillus sp. JX-17]
MNRDKRDIILDEIEHWRSSRLLPEHYCDFLSNLYDEEQQQKERRTLSMAALKQGSLKSWLLSFVIISLIFFIGFYFSSFPWPLQMASAVLSAGICYGFAAIRRRADFTLSLIIAGVGSLLLLGLGAWMISLHEVDPDKGIPILIGVCSVIWCVVGFFLELGILYYCGLVGAVLLYAVLFGQYRPDMAWPFLQLFWLPHSMLLLWLTWLVYQRWPHRTKALFGLSVTVWFMPEADALLLRGLTPPGIAGWVIIKIAVSLILLFVTRKKWIAWVSS